MDSRACELADFLSAAMTAHEERAREKWTGPYHFRAENDRLGIVRGYVDTFLRDAGVLQDELVPNSVALRLLREAARHG